MSPMGSYDDPSTPVVNGESSDKNEVPYEENEEIGGSSEPVVDDDEDEDVFPLESPTFQQLLSQFVQQPTFTELLQPPQQPYQAAAMGQKKNWDLIEDLALISSIMNTSTDATTGTNQKLRIYWGRAFEAFEQARSERPHQIAPRNVEMMKSRWKRVGPPCVKWAGCYDDALRRKKSGQNDMNVLQEAHLLYERSWGKFNLVEQWKALKHFNKWKQLAKPDENPRRRGAGVMPRNISSSGSGSSGKRQRSNEDYPDPDTPTSGPEGGSSSRPDGVKKAKARMKGRMAPNEAVTALDNFGESLRLNTETRAKQLLMQEKKEARKAEQLALEKYKISLETYQLLSQKQNRAPWENQALADLEIYFQQQNQAPWK